MFSSFRGKLTALCAGVLVSSVVVAAPSVAADGNRLSEPATHLVTESALPEGVALVPQARIALDGGGEVIPIVEVGRGMSPDANVSTKWYGAIVKFNKRETKQIAFGATSCAAVATGVPMPAPLKVVLAAACVPVAAAAQLAQASGDCLAVRVFTSGVVVPWYWNC